MSLEQIRLMAVCLRFWCAAGFWAVPFPYAIAITYALEWISRTNPSGATGYAIAPITAITLLIAAIAARTAVAASRGQFLPPSAAAAANWRTPAPRQPPAAHRRQARGTPQSF